ncbi:putative disease resistance protein RGA3 [Dendrobium catenatum]|uniref:Disease resistance protein RGA3 n=1 Tax=Dendrobium catenatum TaxID=906689 RepID=A0A2I0VDX6_9ASPA|nr:putative disease resistance protein RGA3 [Dendrobium catenatum]PKU61612.1 Putative disease resistance protein RGA3 [Dendrobium catenatum]
MADIIAMFSRWAKSGLSTLLDGSSSSSVEPTRGNALDDFQRIMRMLPRIEAVLEDTEEREIQDRSVKLWLSELRCLAYDIDDVIDEYEYDVQTAQMEARAAEESYHHGKHKRGDDERYGQSEHVEGLNTLASSSYQVPAISDGMVEKLREIRERFDEIERDRKGLRLREDDGMRRTVSAQNYRLTSSLVDESNIIGRESEKEKIVKLLLSDLQVSNKIVVIPVVGMGGVGKTTLAQLIYNDPRIRQYFDLHIWIYVSEDFDLVKLTKEIYRSITKKLCEEHVGFDYLQDSIKKELMKFKRTFLVLDDMWNENQFIWESLKAPFHNAGIVNILLTTRNDKVADVMRTMNYFRLGFLCKDEGCRLFNQYALCGDENLMRIGKKIVNKCGGLPLAIKLLGSHLRFERDEEAWMSILESELWDLDPGKNEIFPALKLSYQRLPIHLKPCFRYCSIFLKKRIPDKNHLVWLWMAQGYIQQKRRGKTMEEIGREYFDELLGRSFFQARKFEDSFNMHDLIFDLAVFVSGNEFITMKLEGGNQNKCISNNVRHLAIYDQSAKIEVLKGTSVYPFLGRHVALRSIFCYDESIINNFQLLDSMRLRAVHIQALGWSTISSSIASLKHLRYLGCSHFRNDAISSLFNSLHIFRNVQVLNFLDCYPPIMLPTSIQNLINLRHLILPYGSIMPCGISKLTCLRTLKYVVVMECGGLGEIEDLDNLTGSFCIQLIANAYNFEDFKKANINRKKHIWRLRIDWHDMIDYFEGSFDVHISFKAMVTIEKQSFELEKMKLDALRPHNNLKELEINDYPGIRFPLWLGDPSYSKLQDITLQGCDEWDGSGSVLDRCLPYLRSISIIDCAKLKYIKIVQSSSLKRLLVKQCPEIRTLHGLCSLHTLEKLEIMKCYNLLISVEERLPSKLQLVWFEDCWNLTSLTGMQNLHSLEKLKLRRCLKLRLPLDEQLSTTPSVLEIVDCPGLEEWCQRYGFKSTIQELSKMEELTIRDTSHLIYYYGSKNLVSLKSLHILESDETKIGKGGLR